jgi:hypothetical protein
MGLVPTESDAEAHAAVESAVEAMTQAGIDVHAEVRDTVFGHAADEIVADAREHDAGDHHHGLARAR